MSEAWRVQESIGRRVKRRISWLIRDRFPNRKVRRTVQGVPMVLPWAHRLPDYARIAPDYGQNLVRLAALLGEDHETLQVIDVGANVGDSTLQILTAVPSRVLCVEADPAFLTFLEINVGERTDVEIEPSLLSTSQESKQAMAPVRVGGTTRFEEVFDGSRVEAVTPAELMKRHPTFDHIRLVKSDTDGYDVELVPALAAQLRASRPVLFFEYDHRLSRLAGNDPLAVWGKLERLGYSTVAIWDFAGRHVATTTVRDIEGLTATLDDATPGRSHMYWDVAIVHREDERGNQAVKHLI